VSRERIFLLVHKAWRSGTKLATAFRMVATFSTCAVHSSWRIFSPWSSSFAASRIVFIDFFF
jgi:hypothetical protein